MNCIYRLIVGKPLVTKKKKPMKQAQSEKKVIPNPVLTTDLLRKPLPNTLDELNQLEQMVAKRMSAINSISNSLNQSIQNHMEKGRTSSAREILGRKASLRNDITQLSERLFDIQIKRDYLTASSGLH